MKARGREFFIFYLAHALGMTRRQLMATIDNSELASWGAYFAEINKPPDTERKQTRAEIEGALKNYFAVKSKGKKNA